MTKYIWTLAPAFGRSGQNGREPHLFVLPADVAEHWRARMPVLRCETWGDVRALGADIYEEVLGLAGYGDYDQYVGHYVISGTAPLLAPTLDSEAEHIVRAAAGAPPDESPFRAHDDLAACADGDWPPFIHYLTYECLPENVIDAYASTWETNFNGTYAAILSEHKDSVLAALADSVNNLELEEASWIVELIAENA